MPDMTASVWDIMRNLLSIRTERAVPKRGPRPQLGAKVFRGDVRMTVQAGISADLWAWLQQLGWREVTFRPDRRRYREIPSAWVTELIDSEPDRREAVLEAAMANALIRPSFSRSH